MDCPQCKAWSVVKNTRKRENGELHRQRKCANGHSFSTLEIIAIVTWTPTYPTKQTLVRGPG